MMRHPPAYPSCCLCRVVLADEEAECSEFGHVGSSWSVDPLACRPSECAAKPVRTIAATACRSSQESDGHAWMRRRNSGSFSAPIAASTATAPHSAARVSKSAFSSGISGVVPFLSSPSLDLDRG